MRILIIESLLYKPDRFTKNFSVGYFIVFDKLLV